MEFPRQLRQDELDDAGVHLSHERAAANGTDDKPWIAIKTRQDAQPRRFAPYAEPAGILVGAVDAHRAAALILSTFP